VQYSKELSHLSSFAPQILHSDVLARFLLFNTLVVGIELSARCQQKTLILDGNFMLHNIRAIGHAIKIIFSSLLYLNQHHVGGTYSKEPIFSLNHAQQSSCFLILSGNLENCFTAYVMKKVPHHINFPCHIEV